MSKSKCRTNAARKSVGWVKESDGPFDCPYSNAECRNLFAIPNFDIRHRPMSANFPCDYFALTSIRFVAAWAVFGTRRVNTPLANWASTFSASIPSGSATVRRNEP